MKYLICFLFIFQACSVLKDHPTAKIKMKSIDGKYEINDCVEDWSIAQLSGHENKQAQSKINSSLMRKVLEKSCDHSEEVAGEEYSTKIVANKVFQNFIALESYSSFNSGESEPKMTPTCIVYDLNTGKKVEFESLLVPGYKVFLEELIVKQIWQGKKAEADEFKRALSPGNDPIVEVVNHKVCPTGKGVVLLFSNLEIAPATYKNPEINVSRQDWPKIFKVNDMTTEVFGNNLN